MVNVFRLVFFDVAISVTQVYTVCGIYTGCAVVAVIIIVVLLDKIKLDKDNHDQYGKFSFDTLIATFSHWWRSPYQKLLMVLTFYSGVEQGFVGGDYTKVIMQPTLLVYKLWNSNLEIKYFSSCQIFVCS